MILTNQKQLNLQQFKVLLSHEESEIFINCYTENEIYKTFYTITINNSDTTHFLFTQKNEQREFKTLDAIIKSLKLLDYDNLPKITLDILKL